MAPAAPLLAAGAETEEKHVDKKQARQIVEEIVVDLCGRSGLQNEWEQIDPETTNEIMDKWVAIVLRVAAR